MEQELYSALDLKEEEMRDLAESMSDTKRMFKLTPNPDAYECADYDRRMGELGTRYDVLVSEILELKTAIEKFRNDETYEKVFASWLRRNAYHDRVAAEMAFEVAGYREKYVGLWNNGVRTFPEMEFLLFEKDGELSVNRKRKKN